MKRVTPKKVKRKLIHLSRKHLLRNLAPKKIYDPANNHYIFADPRGGSTWLMEIIQSITNEPVIWEPLDLKLRRNPFKSINFGWRQHIPEQGQWEEAFELFQQLFEGKILEKNSLDYSTFKQLKNSETLLFKICRGNALLPWLCHNFEFKHQPVYLVRHPFAVVSSQLKHGAWDYDFKGFEIPETPFNANYLKHRAFLKTLKTKEEALVASWCLSNLESLNHRHNNVKWVTITYEDFVLNPEKEIQRITDRWNLSIDITSLNLRKDSVTTRADSPGEALKRIANWKTNFDSKQLAAMGRVLDYFEVSLYSKEDSTPQLKFI